MVSDVLKLQKTLWQQKPTGPEEDGNKKPAFSGKKQDFRAEQCHG